MARDLFRIVRNSFWTDKKVLDEFSPEDRFFWIYILTNPRTTQLGIYEFSLSDASKHLGYSKETVNILLKRFEDTYGMIKYTPITGEIAIKNYLRHSIVTGGKPVMDCLIKESKKVKDETLLKYVFDNLKQYKDLNKTVQEFMEKMSDIDNKDATQLVNENGYTKTQVLEHNFNLLYKEYPKKAGRTEAYNRYKLWVTTGRTVSGKKVKLTNQQIMIAIKKYVHKMEESDTDLQFYKNFDTFMGNSLLDYVGDESA